MTEKKEKEKRGTDHDTESQDKYLLYKLWYKSTGNGKKLRVFSDSGILKKLSYIVSDFWVFFSYNVKSLIFFFMCVL